MASTKHTSKYSSNVVTAQFEVATLGVAATTPSIQLTETAGGQLCRMRIDPSDGSIKFEVNDGVSGWVDAGIGGGGGGGSFSGPGSSTDNAIVRFDGTGGATGQNSIPTIDDDGRIHSNLTALGDVLDYFFTGQTENTSEAIKIGFNASNGNHYWTEIESKGNADLSGKRNRSMRFNCRTTMDTATHGGSAVFVVNGEHYTAAATLVNAKLFACTNADSEVFSVGPTGFCESEGGFHSDGGGTNSCVYGAGAGVDGDEPNCTSVGVNAICYGDDAVAIGYGAVAGDSGSTAYQNNVAIGSGAVADVSSCVAIGQGATTSATSGGTVIGSGASVSGNNSVAIGSTAECSGPFGVAIGQGTINTGSGVTIGRGAEGSLAIGYNADSTGHSSAIAMGTSATGGALYTVAIGASANAGHGGSICIGQSATSTAIRQLVIGSDKFNAAEITDVYIGKGVVDALPTDTTYHATGGEGTDIAGADITIAGGKGTGSAAGGSVIFQTSVVGSTGTSLQSLTDRVEIDNSGNIMVGTSTPIGVLTVEGSVSLGSANTLSGNNSLATGSGSATRNHGEIAQSAGYFTTAGDTQVRRLHLRRQTANATPVILSDDNADDTAGSWNCAYKTLQHYKVAVLGHRDNDTEFASFTMEGTVRRADGSDPTSLWDSIESWVQSSAAWDSYVSVGSGGIKLYVVGEAAKNINWSASVELVESTVS